MSITVPGKHRREEGGSRSTGKSRSASTRTQTRGRFAARIPLGPVGTQLMGNTAQLPEASPAGIWDPGLRAAGGPGIRDRGGGVRPEGPAHPPPCPPPPKQLRACRGRCHSSASSLWPASRTPALNTHAASSSEGAPSSRPSGAEPSRGPGLDQAEVGGERSRELTLAWGIRGRGAGQRSGDGVTWTRPDPSPLSPGPTPLGGLPLPAQTRGGAWRLKNLGHAAPGCQAQPHPAAVGAKDRCVRTG